MDERGGDADSKAAVEEARGGLECSHTFQPEGHPLRSFTSAR